MGNRISLWSTLAVLATRALLVLVSTGDEIELLEIEDILAVGGMDINEAWLPSLDALDQEVGSHESRRFFQCL